MEKEFKQIYNCSNLQHNNFWIISKSKSHQSLDIEINDMRLCSSQVLTDHFKCFFDFPLNYRDPLKERHKLISAYCTFPILEISSLYHHEETLPHSTELYIQETLE